MKQDLNFPKIVDFSIYKTNNSKMVNIFIKINGNSYKINQYLTIFSLLLYLGFKIDFIIIDHNGTLLRRKDWSKTVLNNNDHIEILTIAGGG